MTEVSPPVTLLYAAAGLADGYILGIYEDIKEYTYELAEDGVIEHKDIPGLRTFLVENIHELIELVGKEMQHT